MVKRKPSPLAGQGRRMRAERALGEGGSAGKKGKRRRVGSARRDRGSRGRCAATKRTRGDRKWGYVGSSKRGSDNGLII